MTTTRRAALLLGCAALALTIAAPAHADSIAYVKDGNVWLTSPDGAKQVQVTTDGGYESPSQADDGTIVALRGKQMVRMDRTGKQLNAPVDGMGSPATNSSGTFYGPYEPRVSPDGTKIAYWFGQYSDYYSYGCACYLFHLESRTAVSASDRFTDPSSDGEMTKGITQPEWLSNDRLIAGYDFWMNLWTWKLGTGHGDTGPAAQWWAQFKDADGYNVEYSDPALSPDGKKLAMTGGGDPTKKLELDLFSVPGPAWVGEPPYENDYLGNSAVPQPELRCAKQTGEIWNPSWSPDSTRLAYSLPDGLHIATVGADLSCGGVSDALVVPGGAQPDWGPADVPAAAASSGAPAATDNAPVAKPVAAGLAVRKLGLQPKAFRRNATLRFSLSAPARLTISVRGVRGTIRTAGKPGVNALRFKGKIGGRKLKPGRYVMRVVATPVVGGATTRATVPFRVMR